MDQAEPRRFWAYCGPELGHGRTAVRARRQVTGEPLGVARVQGAQPVASGRATSGSGSRTTGRLLRRRGTGTCAQLQHNSYDADRPNGSIDG